jgi:hypothetical protein
MTLILKIWTRHTIFFIRAGPGRYVAVFQIQEILAWIRILGSVLQNYKFTNFYKLQILEIPVILN